mmetsp:Transcript_52844/g.72132  ORF Transcript_52844/g.72132 Transcript_52844/m.72132 type:complete len:139 (-) Transcript_52844:328-744(-)
MQLPENLKYEPHGVAEGVLRELEDRVEACLKAGLPRWLIMVDPGIGFAKSSEQNMELLHPRVLRRLRESLAPVVVGASRKGFIGQLCDEPEPSKRDVGTSAVSCIAGIGGASVIRVHNVEATRQVLSVMDAVVLSKTR